MAVEIKIIISETERGVSSRIITNPELDATLAEADLANRILRGLTGVMQGIAQQPDVASMVRIEREATKCPNCQTKIYQPKT